MLRMVLRERYDEKGFPGRLINAGRHTQILICEGANATGMCFHSTYSLEECHDVPGDLQRNAATFAPDGDGFYCYPRA